MSLLRQHIQGLDLVMEKRELAPHVFCYMVSVANDPIVFPMIFKAEYGGWFFVDKMTLVELVAIEKEISAAIEAFEKGS